MLQITYVILGMLTLGVLVSFAHAENYLVTILQGTSQQDLGLKFYPEILPFRGKDTITWKNEDSTSHRIASGIGTYPEYSGKFFKTGTIAPGDSQSVKIDVKGHFAFYYFCEIHPWLDGKLVIETAPESQPETTNPIVAEKSYQSGDKISTTGQVHYDFRKTPYDVLVYKDRDNLVDVKNGLFDDNSSYTQELATLDPGKYTLKVVYGLPTQIGITETEVVLHNTIPQWIKTEAKWWADGTITDLEFVNAIQYLAKEKIIKVQKSQISQQEKLVPAWLKSSAGWWAGGQISDAEFTKSLQYLSDAGIIQI